MSFVPTTESAFLYNEAIGSLYQPVTQSVGEFAPGVIFFLPCSFFSPHIFFFNCFTLSSFRYISNHFISIFFSRRHPPVGNRSKAAEEAADAAAARERSLAEAAGAVTAAAQAAARNYSLVVQDANARHGEAVEAAGAAQRATTAAAAAAADAEAAHKQYLVAAAERSKVEAAKAAVKELKGIADDLAEELRLKEAAAKKAKLAAIDAAHRTKDAQTSE